MKIFPLFISFLFQAAALSLAAQQVSFSVTGDTVVESNSAQVISYIRLSGALATADSVAVVLIPGSAGYGDINNPLLQIIPIPPNTDSVPFTVYINDDFIVENTESLHFALRSLSAIAVTADSLLAVNIRDNDLPISVHFNSAPLPVGEGTTMNLCWDVTNPNPFPVQYYVRTLFPYQDPKVTAQGGSDYYFDWNFYNAPPGNSTMCETFFANDDTLPELTECVYLIAVDSTNLFNVFDSLRVCIADNDYLPVTARFDDTLLTVFEDTAGRSYKIPVTIVNPNNFYVPFLALDHLPQSTATLYQDYLYIGQIFTYPQGTWHDTLRFQIYDDELVEPTEDWYVKLSGIWPAANADTLFHLRILDRDSPAVSFIGAGYTFVENQGKCAVNVVNNSPLSFPVTVTVRYLNGNAQPGTDFTFRDTTLIFDGTGVDTLPVWVNIIDDQLDEGNEQVNLEIADVQPSWIKQHIRQFTFIIIDDDITATGITDDFAANGGKIFPSPFHSVLNISVSHNNIDRLLLFNASAEVIKEEKPLTKSAQLNTADLAEGLYFMEIWSGGEVSRRKIVKE